jgi:hypothetical protein
MVAGSTRSSVNSSCLSRLVVTASDIGVAWISSTSWISGDRMTTSMLDSESTSTCILVVISGATGASGSGTAPSGTPATGIAISTSSVVVSMAMTSGNVDPSASAFVTVDG